MFAHLLTHNAGPLAITAVLWNHSGLPWETYVAFLVCGWLIDSSRKLLED